VFASFDVTLQGGVRVPGPLAPVLLPALSI
jgi:hypothetical protein